jgi:hypothetical protein
VQAAILIRGVYAEKSVAEPNSGALNFLVWKQPHERFVVQIDDLDPIAERIHEVTAEVR